MKLIGAGFGRTGTLSLKFALEQLGLAPCYHMQEVVKKPQRIAQWQAATDGKPVNWQAMFAGYQATVDYPACLFYKELMDAFPEAKVLLSVREPERWYSSTLETIYGFSQMSTALPLPFFRAFQILNRSLVWDGYFEGRFSEDKAFAIEKYNAHIEAVKATVPPERLLVFSVKEGWEPLCNFLDVPIPATPFPHVNDRKTIQRIFATAKAVSLALPILTLFGVWKVAKRIRQ